MTERVRSLVITLDRDMRGADVKTVVSAIQLMRFVSHVETGPVGDVAAHTNRSIAFMKIKDILWDSLLSLEADKKVKLDGSDE